MLRRISICLSVWFNMNKYVLYACKCVIFFFSFLSFFFLISVLCRSVYLYFNLFFFVLFSLFYSVLFAFLQFLFPLNSFPCKFPIRCICFLQLYRVILIFIVNCKHMQSYICTYMYIYIVVVFTSLYHYLFIRILCGLICICIANVCTYAIIIFVNTL